MKFRDGNLEVSDRYFIVFAHTMFLGSIVDSIEFSDLIAESDFLEKCPDVLALSWLSKCVFIYTNLLKV